MCLTGIEVKRKLWSEGKTLKGWAEENNFSYRDVSDVVRGINKGSYGRGYEIAVKLGMKGSDRSVN